MLNAEAEEGDATTLGLVSELAKPMFIITLYFLSDVLATLGALSLAFQKSDLNLHVEQLISTHVATLQELNKDPYSGGFMIQYQNYDFHLRQQLLTNLNSQLWHKTTLALSSIVYISVSLNLVYSLFLGFLIPEMYQLLLLA